MSAIAFASRYFTVETLDDDTVETLGGIAGAGATDRMYTHSAENQLVKDFLALDKATHLFLTEVDMLMPKDTLVRLADLKVPIATGLYYLRNGNGQPCLYAKGLTTRENPYTHSPVTAFPLDRPFLIDPKGGGCPGVGCALIAREVFERVPYPWFDLKEGMYGSDMYFYTKVRDAGIPVWVDPTLDIHQIDYKLWSHRDYRKRIAEDPAFAGSGFIVGGVPR